jgi:hypothetical protein
MTKKSKPPKYKEHDDADFVQQQILARQTITPRFLQKIVREHDLAEHEASFRALVHELAFAYVQDKAAEILRRDGLADAPAELFGRNSGNPGGLDALLALHDSLGFWWNRTCSGWWLPVVEPPNLHFRLFSAVAEIIDVDAKENCRSVIYRALKRRTAMNKAGE